MIPVNRYLYYVILSIKLEYVKFILCFLKQNSYSTEKNKKDKFNEKLIHPTKLYIREKSVINIANKRTIVFTSELKNFIVIMHN